MGFHEIWYWEISLQFVDIFQSWLILKNNNEHCTWRPTYICAPVWSLIYWIFMRVKNVLKIVEETEHILCSIHFSVSHTVFKRIKRKWGGLPEFYTVCTFPNLFIPLRAFLTSEHWRVVSTSDGVKRNLHVNSHDIKFKIFLNFISVEINNFLPWLKFK